MVISAPCGVGTLSDGKSLYSVRTNASYAADAQDVSLPYYAQCSTASGSASGDHYALIGGPNYSGPTSVRW
jgi:hypothetical protein